MSILQSIARSDKILAPVFITIAVVWLMASCVVFILFVRGSGTVVQLVQKGSGDDAYYCPITVFHDVAGVEHTIRSSSGSNPPRFPVGSTVSVLYRTQNPDAGMIEDRFMLWIAPSLLIFISVFFLAIGFMIGRLPQKKESRNAA